MATVIKTARTGGLRAMLSVETAPYYLYFLLLCMPGLARIGDISLSIVIFPAIIFGYGRAALRFLRNVLPGARSILVGLLGLVSAYAVWSLVSAFGVPSFLRVFRPLFGHASGIGIVLSVFALSRTRQSGEQTRNLTMTLFCALLGASLFAGSGSYGDRIPGFFKHPNQLGVVTGMASIYFICCVLARGFRSMPFNVGALICIAGLFLSGSKTNLVVVGGLAAVSVMILALLDRNPRRAILAALRDYMAVGALAALAIPILSIVNVRASSVLSSLFSGDEEVSEYGTVVARQDLWTQSWESFKESPVFGVGAGQRFPDGTEHSHNIFLDALRTTGFPGFFIILIFILIVVFYIVSSLVAGRTLSRFPESPLSDPQSRGPFVGCMMAMMGYLLSNQMSDSFGPSTLPFFYLFLGLSTYFITIRLPRGGPGA